MALYFCSLASGSSGNCQYIASEKAGILLDAGLSGKYIHQSLLDIGAKIENLKALFITHEHSDHVKSAGILMRKYGLTLYITPLTFEKIAHKLGKYAEDKVVFLDKNKKVFVDDICVEAFSVSHDAVDAVAYTFEVESNKMGIITDLGHVPLEVLDHMLECQLLMLESNHDEDMLNAGSYPYPLKRRILSHKGHISNVAAAEAIVRTLESKGPLGHVILGHLSQDNNTPALAYETVKEILEQNAWPVGERIHLDLAYRSRVGKLYRLSEDTNVKRDW